MDPRSRARSVISSREDAEIAEFGGILRRNDEAEMMPVIPATLGESALVYLVRRRVEHPGFRSVPRHAVSLQISDVPGQRRRAKARAVMTDHARLHHHTSRGRSQRQRERSTPAPTEAGPASTALAASKAIADMSGLLCGHMTWPTKALRTREATPSRTPPGRTRTSLSRRLMIPHR